MFLLLKYLLLALIPLTVSFSAIHLFLGDGLTFIVFITVQMFLFCSFYPAFAKAYQLRRCARFIEEEDILLLSDSISYLSWKNLSASRFLGRLLDVISEDDRAGSLSRPTSYKELYSRQSKVEVFLRHTRGVTQRTYEMNLYSGIVAFVLVCSAVGVSLSLQYLFNSPILQSVAYRSPAQPLFLAESLSGLQMIVLSCLAYILSLLSMTICYFIVTSLYKSQMSRSLADLDQKSQELLQEYQYIKSQIDVLSLSKSIEKHEKTALQVRQPVTGLQELDNTKLEILSKAPDQMVTILKGYKTIAQSMGLILRQYKDRFDALEEEIRQVNHTHTKNMEASQRLFSDLVDQKLSRIEKGVLSLVSQDSLGQHSEVDEKSPPTLEEKTQETPVVESERKEKQEVQAEKKSLRLEPDRVDPRSHRRHVALQSFDMYGSVFDAPLSLDDVERDDIALNALEKSSMVQSMTLEDAKDDIALEPHEFRENLSMELRPISHENLAFSEEETMSLKPSSQVHVRLQGDSNADNSFKEEPQSKRYSQG